MNHRRLCLLLLILLLIISVFHTAFSQDSIKVWKEFVSELKKGELTAERLRLYDPTAAQTFLEWLRILKDSVRDEEFNLIPEIHKVGNQLHYLTSLDSGRANFCFTILLDHGKWYFQHLETITIRLDKIPSLPVSQFPDLLEDKKAWMREELYWSQQIYFFNKFSTEKGEKYVLDLYKDGYGYALAAKVWVPFVTPEKAFILYLCWEQTNLRGNKLVLEQLDNNQAVVKFTYLIYFELYKHSSHLKQSISYEDYIQIFESIWQDRAEKAGWNLEIKYNNVKDEYTFLFQKEINN